MRFTVNSQKMLKVLHLYLAAVWCGGAASLFAIHCLYFPNSGPELYARNMALIFIDYYIIVPAAVGSILTGLFYSQWTHWGYLKHYWIIVKWGLTLFIFALGVFWLVPWLNTIMEISMALRDTTVIDYSRYDVADFIHFGMTVAQTALLLFMIIISVIKPWGKTEFKW